MRVSGEGPNNARIAIVGEAPGMEEDYAGRPFVGSSGKLLDALLTEAGINRNSCYITNVVKERPPGNNFNIFYEDTKRTKPTPALLEARAEVVQEIQELSPNVTIALGNEAMKALTGRSGIQKWRGSIQEGKVGKVIASLHPAAVLRMYNWRPLVLVDLKRAKEESTHPEAHLPSITCHVMPRFSQVVDYIEMLRVKKKPVAFDIETSGSHVRCLGLSNQPNEAFCIPFCCSPFSQGVKKGRVVFPANPRATSFWSLEEEMAILRLLDELMSDPDVPKVAQNYPFDASILEREFGFVTQGLWMDTMLVHNACYSELPKSLDFLTSFYTRHPRYSDYNPASDQSTWVYNCHDAAITGELAPILRKEAEDLGVWSFYKRHIEPTMISASRMGNRGVEIDMEYFNKLKAALTKKKEEMEEELNRLCGINPRSPKQVKEFLYGKMGLPPEYTGQGEKRRISTCEECLERLRRKHPEHSGILDLILKPRQLSTLLGNFFSTKFTEDGRITTSYNVAGTSGGRISSSADILGIGTNLQNIPKRRELGKTTRRAFRARKGNILVRIDLSQAEARYVAWDSKNRPLIKAFLDPSFDVHTRNASLIFQKPQDEITPEERFKGKTCVHSANYKGGPRTAEKAAKVSYRFAKEALDRYKLGNAPYLQRWWESIEREVCNRGMIRTKMGRIRIFLGRRDQTTFRSAISYKPQSDIGDVINQSLYNLDKDLPEGCFPILQVHDEVVCEAPVELALPCAIALDKALTHTFTWDDVPEPLIIPREICIGFNWYDLKQIELTQESIDEALAQLSSKDT